MAELPMLHPILGGKKLFLQQIGLTCPVPYREIVGNNGSSVSITSSMIHHIMVPIHLTSHLARILRAWSSTWLRRLCIHYGLAWWQAMLYNYTPGKWHIPWKLVVGRCWETTFLLGFGLFSGAMLVLGRVPSWEVTYPSTKPFLSRWFSFSRLVGYLLYTVVACPCSLRGYSNITMSECVMAYHVMIDVVASVHFCHCS